MSVGYGTNIYSKIAKMKEQMFTQLISRELEKNEMTGFQLIQY